MLEFPAPGKKAPAVTDAAVAKVRYPVQDDTVALIRVPGFGPSVQVCRRSISGRCSIQDQVEQGLRAGAEAADAAQLVLRRVALMLDELRPGFKGI